MSSPGTPDNAFRTPESSPEVTETNLRQIEDSLTRVRDTLDSTVEYFDNHFQQYSDLTEGIQESLDARKVQQVVPNNEVSEPQPTPA